MVQPGDKVMVALSGGKDSYTLFQLMHEARMRAPFDFEIIGFHLDQGQPGYDNVKFREWLEAYGQPYKIHSEDTYTTVMKQATTTLCAPCSRLRRGVIYTWAERLECNKIALGHHRDDALETLLLNLFYGGKLQSMPATYTTQNERFEVLRPLIECAESDIEAYAKDQGYPIMPCNLCGSQEGLKRAQMTSLLAKLEQHSPMVRQVMLSALKNVRPSHLLDTEVASAWSKDSHNYKQRQ